MKYELEIAYDGHNNEIWSDISEFKKINPNTYQKKRLQRILILKNDNPTISNVIDQSIDYLNEKHNAGITKYHRDQPHLVPSYHYVSKTPFFEIEEYEHNKFKVHSNLMNRELFDEETIEKNKKAEKVVKEKRKIDHNYEILVYGYEKKANPYKYNGYWGVTFRMLEIAPNLCVRQELNIIRLNEDEDELTFQNFIKKCVVEINSYHWGFIEEYNLNKPINKKTISIIEEGELPLEILDYGILSIADGTKI